MAKNLIRQEIITKVIWLVIVALLLFIISYQTYLAIDKQARLSFEDSYNFSSTKISLATT